MSAPRFNQDILSRLIGHSSDDQPAALPRLGQHQRVLPDVDVGQQRDQQPVPATPLRSSLASVVLRPLPPPIRTCVRALAGLLSRDLLVGQRMAASFVIELHAGLLDGLVEVFGSGEGLVSEVMALHVAGLTPTGDLPAMIRIPHPIK